MTNRIRLTLACSATLLSIPAFSQDTAAPAPTPIMAVIPASKQATIPGWPEHSSSNNLIVITLAQPGVRHKCTLGSLTPEALVCVSDHGHEAVSYKPEEVEALINPREGTFDWIAGTGVLVVGGGLMFAAVLLNPITEAGAVTVGLIAGYAAVAGFIELSVAAASRTPDRLLYLATDHKLSVALRK